jgi:hypothetical protein
MLETFAVVGAPEEIPGKLVARYGGLVDRVSVTFRHTDDPDRWRGVIAAIRQGA